MGRDNPPSLLLLPALPAGPVSRKALRTAYRPALEMALSRCKDATKSTTLIVAVVGSFLEENEEKTHRVLASWAQAQSLLAGLYTTIAGLCVHLDIASDMDAGPGSVDARVVLVEATPTAASASNTTTIVDLPTLSRAYHPWQTIFHVQSAAGRALHNQFLTWALEAQTIEDGQLVAVAAGPMPSSTSASASAPPEPRSPPGALHRSILGGTFDHLHPGHKLLLAASALLVDAPQVSDARSGEPGPEPGLLVIGVTGDELLQNKKYAEYVQPWDVRARNVLYFLNTVFGGGGASQNGDDDDKASNSLASELSISEKEEGFFEATFRGGAVVAQCAMIHNAYGPTIEREGLDILVVSAETRAGGQAVNDKRTEMGWHPLAVYEVDVLNEDDAEGQEAAATATATATAASFDAKISSTAIRKHRAEAAAAAAGAGAAAGTTSDA